MVNFQNTSKVISMKLSIAQFSLQFGEPSQNLESIRTMARQAGRESSNLLLLPELCLHGYHSETIKNNVKFHLAAILPELGEIAKEFSLDLCGSFIEDEGGFQFNTLIYLDRNGQLLAKYRKTHLFKPLREHLLFHPGNHITVVETAFGKLGLAICYDIRFPEMFRAMTSRGVKGFLISAEWPVERIEHWQILLKARAIENLAWIAGCNCTGSTRKTEFGGSSMFISPWGETLAQLEGESCRTIEFDPAITDQIRQNYPFLDDMGSFTE